MKLAVLITARLKSERLKRKALAPILGRPMIAHQIDRLRTGERPESVIVCTSKVEQDDDLASLARAEGAGLYRGEPEDVLKRVRDASHAFDCDAVFVCGADNPLVDPVEMDRLLAFLVDGGYDYATTTGLPFGAFGWAVTRPALERACAIKATDLTEAWLGYFTQTGLFRCGELEARETARRPGLRITVDTPQDFQLMTRIFEALYRLDGKAGPTPAGDVFPLEDVIRLCDERPELPALNASVQQKTPLPIRLRPDWSEPRARVG